MLLFEITFTNTIHSHHLAGLHVTQQYHHSCGLAAAAETRASRRHLQSDLQSDNTCRPGAEEAMSWPGRTHLAAAVADAPEGTRVTVCGWVDRYRWTATSASEPIGAMLQHQCHVSV